MEGTEMIKELIIECEEITRVETFRALGNDIQVTLSKVHNQFLEQLDAKEIVQGMDSEELMQAIADIYGREFIRDWHDGLGK